MSESRLRVFTLNCWGLKYVSKHRTQRVNAIVNVLAASDYDIIALQELWVFTDYELVRAALSKSLPYAKFFYSGALGAGLSIFSRFPITAATVHPYSLNGSPIDVIAGDWFVGKAAASVLIAHPVLGQVQIFNTHLFAKGGDEGPDHHKAHRLVNAWEFAKLARQAAEMGRYVIAAGDFNSVPTAPPMVIIRDYANLIDGWVESHPNTRLPSLTGVPTPHEAIDVYGVTADSPLNTYSAGKRLEPIARKYQGKRLDYVFYRQPCSPPAPKRIPVLKCVESRVILTEQVPGSTFSFSDHFGLETTFEISLPDSGEDAQSEVYAPEFPTRILSTEVITATLQSLTSRYRFALTQARLHLSLFAFCIILLLTIIISSAWLPRSWINPIFMLLTVFLAWLGTTMLYVGFIFGRWEVNALTNIIEELEIQRNGIESRRGSQSASTL